MRTFLQTSVCWMALLLLLLVSCSRVKSQASLQLVHTFDADLLPCSVAADGMGYIYVGTCQLNEVVRMTTAGTITAEWNATSLPACADCQAPEGSSIGVYVVGDKMLEMGNTAYGYGHLEVLLVEYSLSNGTQLSAQYYDPPDEFYTLNGSSMVLLTNPMTAAPVYNQPDAFWLLSVGGYELVSFNITTGKLINLTIDVSDVAWAPLCMASDSSGLLHIGVFSDVNLSTGAVVVYTSSGELVSTFTPNATEYGLTEYWPTAIAIAPDGSFYVGEGNNCTIYRYSAAYTLLGNWSLPCSLNTDLDDEAPYSFGMSPNGTLYIVSGASLYSLNTGANSAIHSIGGSSSSSSTSTPSVQSSSISTATLSVQSSSTSASAPSVSSSTPLVQSSSSPVAGVSVSSSGVVQVLTTSSAFGLRDGALARLVAGVLIGTAVIVLS